MAGLRPIPAISGGDIGLHADDGPDAFLACQLVKRPSPEHAPVVGECEARHLEFLDLVNEVGEAIGSVEEGVLGMRVEVDEAHSARFGQSG